MYKNKFFKTKEEAKAFQKSNGGALYSNVKGSRTKQYYMDELLVLERFDEEFINEHPYVVAWNE